MVYQYIKAPPGYTLDRPPSLRTRLRIFISAVLLTLGIASFTSVAYPFLSFYFSLEASNHNPLIVQANEPRFLPEMISTTFDYTDSKTWFAQTSPPVSNSQPEVIYTLSIPKLGIENAIVRNDHTDLKLTLIQYQGTAFPGDLGNTVIFGHSVLPQFFNPKNYTTIFSTLHTLIKGDQIIINSEGAKYIYQISDIYSVDPDNLSPLAQTYDKHRLTLITCTPPGTYLKRLIIRADLI